MTLIELLIAITISSIVLSLILGSSAFLIRLNRKLDISRELQKEISFAMERMTDKIHTQSINYASYNPKSNTPCADQDPSSTNDLCVGDTNFTFQNNMLFENKDPLFSKEYQVIKTIFHITPTKDPVTNFESENQIQPRVTIFVKVISKESPEINSEIQTTLSSRQYE